MMRPFAREKERIEDTHIHACIVDGGCGELSSLSKGAVVVELSYFRTLTTMAR